MNLRNQFPILKNNPELIYLDSASTSQKPQQVIDSLVDFYSKHNANVHRGLYPLAEKATKLYEDARKTIAEFINAEPEEIIFTGGTTDGINKIAESLKISGMLSEKPKVLLTELEHHSNILPWQRLAKEMFYIPVQTEAGEFEISTDEHFYPIEEPYDVLTLTHISNVTGSITDVQEMVKYSRYHNPKPHYIMLDAAQSIIHMPIDVKALDVDFMVFSGHKMYGPTGIGVIYGKKEILKKMEPFHVGGGMIREVKRASASWAPLPEKFEAGTPPIAEAVALAEAVRFIQNLGFEKIQPHENLLRKYLVEKLMQIPGLKLYHPPLTAKAAGVVSFSVDGIHPHDIAQFLGDNNVCVRAGHHCTQILHREILQIPASVRVSLGVYNTEEDIEKFVSFLKESIKHFRK